MLSELPPIALCAAGYGTSDHEATRRLYGPLLREQIPGEWVRATLVVVETNRSIPPHRDGIDAGTMRRMAVLQSSPDSWCFHDGCWQQLEEGGIYEGDPLQLHAAIHWGPEPRIHLVVDARA